MSLRIIKRDPASGDKEVILEIDPIQSSPGGQTYSVTGKVTDDKGVVQPNKTVILFDSVLISDPVWGKQIPIAFGFTNAKGEYLIYYSTNTLSGKLYGDLQVKIFDVSPIQNPPPHFQDPLPDPLPVAIALSAVYVNALPQETIDVNVASAAFVGVSEYSKITEDIDLYLSGSTVTDIASLTLKDIDILSSKIGVDKLYVATYLKAVVLEDEISAIAAPSYSGDFVEVVYGLLRYGLPLTKTEFLATSDAEKTQALKAIAESNIIDPEIAQETNGSFPVIEGILGDFSNAEAGDGLTEVVQNDTGSAEIADSLISQLLDEANFLIAEAALVGSINKANFYAFYLANFETSEDFWTAIVGTITADQSAAAKHVFQLNTVTQTNVPLIHRLIEDGHFSFDGTVFQFDALIALSFAQWSSMIAYDGTTNGVGIPTIQAPPIEISAGPPQVTSPTTQEVDGYVIAILTAIEASFPLEVFIKDLNYGTPATDIEKFFQFNLDELDTLVRFDFKRSSPKQFVSQYSAQLVTYGITTPIDVLHDLYKYKRLHNLVDGYNKLTKMTILEDQLFVTSATEIVAQGRRAFVKAVTDLNSPDLTTEEAEFIYQKASQKVAAALAVQSDFSPQLNTTEVNVMPSQPISNDLSDPNVVNYPQLEVLFGSLDYCTCKHCQSSTSPAAYLIDLLSFIKDAQGDAWDALISRRPEITSIDLTCENTNTVMPYIDLVIEVLEQAISEDVNYTDRQTTQEANTLRVMPENIQVSVYDTLAQAVYPWTLPFHLWNEEASAYLDLIKIDRSEVIRTVAGNAANGSGISTEQALLQLGISDAFNVTLTHAAFTGYYGGANQSTLEPVEELLKRTGLEYSQLISLLESDYINPGRTISIDFAVMANTSIESCKLEDATLVFPDETTNHYYKRLHRFERLRKVLGWTVDELDTNLKVFGNVINDAFIAKIAGINQLSTRFKTKIHDISTWYGSLSQLSYGEKDSQFDSVFLNPRYVSKTEVRDAIANAHNVAVTLRVSGELYTTTNVIEAVAPALLGILRVSASDLLLLVNEILATDTADKVGLSKLYSVAQFTRVLKISVKEYVDLKALYGSDPIGTDPDSTLAFLFWYDQLKKSKLKIADLNYLFRNDFGLIYAKSTETKISDSIGVVRSKAQAVFADVGIGITKSREDLFGLFSLFFSEEVAAVSVELSELGTASMTDPDDPTTELVDGAIVASVWSKALGVASDSGEVTALQGAIASGTLQDRIDGVFEGFHAKLLDVLSLKDVVVQAIADDIDTSTTLVDDLLTNHLSYNSNPAIDELFLSDAFLMSASALTQNHLDCYLLLQKISVIADRFKIDTDQLSFILSEVGDTGWYDLTTLPVGVSTAVGNSFIRLLQAISIDRQYRTADFSVFDLIEGAIAGKTIEEIHEILVSQIGWDRKDIDFVASNEGYSETGLTINDYKNEIVFLILESIMTLSQRIGFTAEQLFSIGNSSTIDLTYEQSRSLLTSIKSNFSESAWQKLGQETRDKLRRKQRSALTAYLIGDSSNSFNNVNDLYGHFLLDTEIEPCFLTSRMKMALSTCQLWVQRIVMDLEVGLSFSEEEMEEWKWRKNYRVWEAARKVFMYPENWIEPELRDDKSSFFQEMEDELLQDEVTDESAERVYLNYLQKLDEVANMEIAGVCQEEGRNQMHVFARTRNTPHRYFHRKWKDKFHWTSWEAMDLDIEGEHLIPVVFNRRPMIFWPIFTEKPVELTNSDLSSSTPKLPKINLEIQLAYSEFANGRWQPKKISKVKVVSGLGLKTEKYFFKTNITEEGLDIDCFFAESNNVHYRIAGSFKFGRAGGELKVTNVSSSSIPSNFSITNTKRHYMKLMESPGFDIFEIGETIKYDTKLEVKSEFKLFKRRLLNSTPDQFLVTYPVTNLELLSELPFFYEDNKRIFFVYPSEQTFEKTLMVEFAPILVPVIKPDSTAIPTAPAITYYGSYVPSPYYTTSYIVGYDEGGDYTLNEINRSMLQY